MIGVEEDGKIEFIAQALYKSGDLPNADELALALRHTNQHGDVQFFCGREHRPQLHRICDIEVADRYPETLCLL
jgi:hypothetical protein